MLRVDLETRRLEASVRDLVQRPEGIPRALGPIARVRAELGTEIHRRYRATRAAQAEGFQAEVALRHELHLEGFEVRLRGRADGVTSTSGSALVEEVKSVAVDHHQLQRLVTDGLPAACAQLRLYCLMLAARSPDCAITGRLVLVSAVDGSWREIEVPWDPERTTSELARLVRRAVAVARQDATRAAERRVIAGALHFPYAETRPNQQELIDHIEQALERRRPILAMAPTGIGKTVAAMLPGLRYALTHDATLLFLTSKNTQQARVAETFADLLPEGQRPRALTLRAKASMCPPGTQLCHPDHCTYLRNVLDAEVRGVAVAALASGTDHVEPDAVYAVGERQTLCPHALSLALTRVVDVVICDMNYVYDPFVSLAMLGAEQAPSAVVVLDEAHNLFDRARAYYSPFLAATAIEDVIRAVERGDLEAPAATGQQPQLTDLHADVDGTTLFGDVTEFLGELRDVLGSAIGRVQGDELPTIESCSPVAADALPWDALGTRAAHLLVRYAHYNQVHRIVRPEDPLVELLQKIYRLRELARQPEQELVPYLAVDDGAPLGPGAGVLCVNPASRLTPRYQATAGTVAMSATLVPIDYWADVLGLTPLDPARISLASPFPEENRLVRIVPTVDTSYRGRDRSMDAIASLIDAAVATRRGHYVAYFPSFEFLEAVRQGLKLPAGRLLVQHRGMNVTAREAVLDRLQLDTEPLLLLAVTGGVFAEGIDLPGEALVGAFVVGPALPQVGFERAVMQHYFDDTSADGFGRAMLYPGMQRVIQAAGRVHRTPDDVGVILLLGRRFAQHRYAGCLPAWWLPPDTAEIVTDDPRTALQAFWRDAPTPWRGRNRGPTIP